MAVGVSLNGGRWGRGGEVVAIGFAKNRLSFAHRSVLARGGKTFFLGDGALRNQPEQTLEAYYLFMPSKEVTATLDAQHIANPGYNADRGPANFVGLRLHWKNEP